MEKETTFIVTKNEMELFKGELVKDMRISNELKYRKNPFLVDSAGQFVLDVKTTNTKYLEAVEMKP